jgi:hypothetical protein
MCGIPWAISKVLIMMCMAQILSSTYFATFTPEEFQLMLNGRGMHVDLASLRAAISFQA